MKMLDRSDRGLVVVDGSDARSFLQNLLSQDLDPVPVGEWTHTLLLTPQGKLDVDVRLYRAGDDELWLDTEPGYGERLAASLSRYRIRVKADVTDRSAEFGCLSVWGGDDAPPDVEGVAVLRVDAPRGFDLIGPRVAVAGAHDGLEHAGVEPATAEKYEAARIDAGVPRQGPDLDDKTIAQEAWLDVDAVSFTKGCFIGQELVCRIDSRGHVNRFLRRVELVDGARPPRGAELVTDAGKVVGSLTSVTPPGFPWLALGYARREVEPPAELTARWDGDEARVRVLEIPPRVD
jgi:folate-binding protein YgfZ